MREEIKTNRTAEEIFRLFRDESHAIFLDSALRDETLGQYSVILFDPFLVFSAKGGNIEIVKNGCQSQHTGDALRLLQNLLKQYAVVNTPDAFPCEHGCAAGFVSYDFGSVLEKLPERAIEEMDIPHLMFGFYDTAIISDHKTGRTYVCAVSVSRRTDEDPASEENPASEEDPASEEERDRHAHSKIDRISGIILHGEKLPGGQTPGGQNTDAETPGGQTNGQIRSGPRFASDFTAAGYCGMVQKAREYIYNGDIFQVNLSRRVRTKLDCDAYEIYQRLRTESEAPFACYISFGDLRIMSSSPERFFHVKDGWIETRPIKGTRPRGRTEQEDLANREELSSSQKDHAELMMIVDLERNDLGKICRIGSVEVTELVALETYANVFHLVATIRGELLDKMDATDCIRATFPGGSITGAPKIRAMEIIDELEPVKRNIYTGAIGYIGFDGTSDFNIAIRTIVANKDAAFYQVGGGIVWDSVPEKEYQETIDKGTVLQRVLEGKGVEQQEQKTNADKNEPAAGIDDTDFGFLYGFSLFETFLVQGDGTVLLLEEHAARLFSSAKKLGFHLDFDKNDWIMSVMQYIKFKQIRSQILRVTVPFGNAGGIRPSIHYSVREYIESANRACGIRLHVSETRRNETSPLCGHKTGNYAVNFLALQEAVSLGYDDVLFLNSHKHIAETAKCNLFFVTKGMICTPDLSCGILPGIIRGFVINTAESFGIEVQEGQYTLEDLCDAQEIFVTNSVAGILPVTYLYEEAANRICFGPGSPGPVSAMIQKAYNQIQPV